MMTVMMMMMMTTPMQQKSSIYVFFFTHHQYGHSIEEELYQGPRARQTPLPPSNNNVVDLAVGGWLFSLVFLLVVVVVVILFLGFFPLLSSLQFLHLEQTLCFLFWVRFVFCLQVGGRDIQDLK